MPRIPMALRCNINRSKRNGLFSRQNARERGLRVRSILWSFPAILRPQARVDAAVAEFA
jgi:hypothetical protein